MRSSGSFSKLGSSTPALHASVAVHTPVRQRVERVHHVGRLDHQRRLEGCVFENRFCLMMIPVMISRLSEYRGVQVNSLTN